MNHYPAWWSTTITLYNKYTDPTTRQVKWFPHKIEGCFYNHVKDRLSLNNSVIESDSSKCRIRVDERFVNPNDWKELTDKEKLEKFTLASSDIIVAGDVDDVVDEQVRGSRSSDLLAKYHDWPGCFTIEVASINVGIGRPNEHYSAKGK